MSDVFSDMELAAQRDSKDTEIERLRSIMDDAESVMRRQRDERLRLQRELAEARGLLWDCREFVDANSEPWYQTGQRMLKRIDAFLTAADQPTACNHVWTEKVERPVCMICGTTSDKSGVTEK
jgi:hypothetical protein